MGNVPWRRLVGEGARASILFEGPASGGWSRWTSPGRVSMDMSPERVWGCCYIVRGDSCCLAERRTKAHGSKYRPLKDVLKKVIPLRLLGGWKNWKLFLKRACTFVTLQHGETFSVHDLRQKMRLAPSTGGGTTSSSIKGRVLSPYVACLGVLVKRKMAAAKRRQQKRLGGDENNIKHESDDMDMMDVAKNFGFKGANLVDLEESCLLSNVVPESGYMEVEQVSLLHDEEVHDSSRGSSLPSPPPTDQAMIVEDGDSSLLDHSTGKKRKRKRPKSKNSGGDDGNNGADKIKILGDAGGTPAVYHLDQWPPSSGACPSCPSPASGRMPEAIGGILADPPDEQLQPAVARPEDQPLPPQKRRRRQRKKNSRPQDELPRTESVRPQKPAAGAASSSTTAGAAATSSSEKGKKTALFLAQLLRGRYFEAKLGRILHFLFEEVIVPLLRHHFHCVTNDTINHATLFFRKCDWNVLQTAAEVALLEEKNVDMIEAADDGRNHRHHRRR